MKAVCTKLKRLGEKISSPAKTCTDLPDSARTMFVDSKLPDSERAPFTSDSIGTSPTVLDEEFETHTADDMPEHLGTYNEPDTFAVLPTEEQIEENSPIEKEEKAVIARAKSHRPNLVVDSVKGDGNCLFRSLAKQAGGEEEHEALRTAIVAEVDGNADEYVPFLTRPLNQWCQEMIEGAWGDGICLRAARKVLDLPIVVFRKGMDQDPTVFLPPNTNEEKLSKPLYVELDDASENAAHYDPLIQEDPLSHEHPDDDKGKRTKSNKLKRPREETRGRSREREGGKRKKPKKNSNKSLEKLLIVGVEQPDKKVSKGSSKKKRKGKKTSTKTKLQDDGDPACATCRKCGLWAAKANMRVTGKKQPCWICKFCHSRYTSLYRLYGKWPPENYKLMDEEKKKEFWTKLREANGKKAIQKIVEENIKIGTINQVGSKTKGEYLPLSVYKKQGWNVKRIKEFCKDTISDPIVGKLYRVNRRYSFENNYEEHRHEEVIGGSSQIEKAPLPKAATNQNIDHESVRAAKAVATQEARKVNAAKKIATQWLGKFVKASFNLNSLTRNKFVKKVDPANLEPLNQAKTAVQDMVKRLHGAMQGKDMDFGKDECKVVYEKVNAVSEKLLSFAHANACQF